MPNFNDTTGRAVKGAVLRLPPEIRTAIEHQARRQRRSMNSQIIVLLEKALEAEATTKEGEAA